MLACAPQRVVGLLALDRAGVLRGEVWRLWTGHLVHYAPWHATLDITMLLVLAAVAEREMGARAMGRLLLLGAPAISLCLLLAAPDIRVYMGSSALSALLGMADGVLLWRGVPRLRAVLASLAVLAAAKTLGDALGWFPGLSSLPDGVRVAWQAHVAGAAFALAWLLMPKIKHG